MAYYNETKLIKVATQIVQFLRKYITGTNSTIRQGLKTDTMVNYCKLKGFTNPDIKDILSIKVDYKGLDKITFLCMNGGDGFEKLYNQPNMMKDNKPILLFDENVLMVFIDYSLLTSTENSDDDLLTFAISLSESLNYLNDCRNTIYISHLIVIILFKVLFDNTKDHVLKDEKFLNKFDTLGIVQNDGKVRILTKYHIDFAKIIDDYILGEAGLYLFNLFEKLEIVNYIMADCGVSSEKLEGTIRTTSEIFSEESEDKES